MAEDESPNEKEKAALIVDSEAPSDDDGSYNETLGKTLLSTEQEVLRIDDGGSVELAAWQTARTIVEKFKPVPFFIWRLSSHVIGKSGHIEPITESLMFGMRRLLFAIASDELLGEGQKINSVREALKVVKPDVVAGVSVIHSICRRMQKCAFDRMWRAIIDDAVVRARIGHYVGSKVKDFGSGRGMLAGFAGRSGLALLIASADLEHAQDALEKLAAGGEIREVGKKVYNCDPLQVGAMVLSASGCNRDAAFGIVSFASKNPLTMVTSDEQLKWLAAFTITEKIRAGKPHEIDEKLWSALGFNSNEEKEELSAISKTIVRMGHGWGWMV